MREPLPALTCAFALALTAAHAQAPPAGPGPEHAKLAYFVGKWKTEGMMNASPFGPGGKMTSDDTCEWFEVKVAVICRSKGQGPTGPINSIDIMGYNPTKRSTRGTGSTIRCRS